MCFKQHLLLILSFIALIPARKVNEKFPLLTFREINDVKLLIDYKNIELPLTSNVYAEIDELMQDLTKLNCDKNDICSAEKRILIDDIVQKNSTLKRISKLETKNLNRKKREWTPWGNFLKWSGGVMNAEDRSDLHRYLMNLYENQTKMTDQLARIEMKLNQPAQLKVEEDTRIEQLQKDVQKMKVNFRLQNLKERFARISIHIDAILSTHINGFVDGMLIDEELLNSLDGARNSLRNDRQFICENSLDCVKNTKAKVIYKSGNFHFALELPIATANTFKLLEVLSVPVAHNSYAVILKSQYKHLLWDQENEDLMTVTEDILNHCLQSDSNEMFCEAKDIISSVHNVDCLFVAVHDKSIDIQACAKIMELMELESFGVIKLDRGSFWIYSEAANVINTTCHGNHMESRIMTGIEMIKLKFGCNSVINGIKLTSYEINSEKPYSTFNASISIESLREIIKNIEPASDLSRNIPYDLETLRPSGLKEKSHTHDESWQAKNQWQESEIKVLHAEHNKAIIIALIITVAALLFLVFRKHKSIFIVGNIDKASKDQDSVSELDVHLKADVK